MYTVMKLFQRSKELQDDYESTHTLLNAKDEQKQDTVITSIIRHGNTPPLPHIQDRVMSVPEYLFHDLQLDAWISSIPTTKGGKKYLQELFHHPIVDTDLLNQRANHNQPLPHNVLQRCQTLLDALKKDEHVALWVCSLPPIREAWPISLLFPMWPIIRLVNMIPIALMAFHIYRAFISPWLNILYPASTILGPWFYIRKQMKWNLPLLAYLRMVKLGLGVMMKPTGDYYKDFVKYLTFIVYLMLFVYGTVQSFDAAFMLQTILKDLKGKMQGLQRFVQNAYALKSELDRLPWQSVALYPETPTPNPLPPLHIACNMSSLYSLWSSPDAMSSLKQLVNQVYQMDTWIHIQTLRQQKGWCVPEWSSRHPAFVSLWAMGHPELHIRNPVDLTRNLIITGPNAGGKTTYMKSVAINILLAQTMGITCAYRAIMRPVDVMGSFIRVQDTVGSASLFEAEVQRCGVLLQQAEAAVTMGKTTLLLLDEPMHSTPPTEGAATAMAVIERLGRMPGVRVLCTTHYHNITMLPKQDPSMFLNVSMDAIAYRHRRNGKTMFRFPYRIKRGASYQCIALELLRAKDIPNDVVTRAIEIKNKICAAVIE